MNISLPFAEISPVRVVPGFRGFSCLKRDGVLKTGLEASVTDQNACQVEINKLANIQFPDQFAVVGNRWSNQDGRLIVEQLKKEYRIRFYDTASGFEADSRVVV